MEKKKKKRKRGRQCSETRGKKAQEVKKGGLKEENLRRKTLPALGFWDKVVTLAKDDDAVLSLLKLSAEGMDGAEGTARRS